MVSTLRKAGAWMAYRLVRAYWWIRRPVVLGVRVLVADEDRVLLVNHSYRDGWFLPGGMPEPGESLVAAARREVREETGIPVRDVALLGIYSSLATPVSNHVAVFTGQVEKTRTNLETSAQNPEVETVQWSDTDRLPASASAQTRSILQDWRRRDTATYRVVAPPRDANVPSSYLPKFK
jgi:8-oxo-dGTP pyrophosphatase MutT (NUDIX family)